MCIKICTEKNEVKPSMYVGYNSTSLSAWTAPQRRFLALKSQED
jgi:hypothetical protein